MRTLLFVALVAPFTSFDVAAQSSLRLQQSILSTTVTDTDSTAPSQGGRWEMWFADSTVTTYRDGAHMANSRYTVHDSTFTIRVARGAQSSCNAPGDYYWRFQDSVTVRFTLVHDLCLPRKAMLGGRLWTYLRH